MKAVIACAVAIGCVASVGHAGESQTAKTITVTATPTSARPGDLVVLTIVTPVPVESVRVRAFNRDLPSFGINKTTTFSALVGIDLAVVPGTYRIAIESGATRTLFPLLVTARKFATRTLNVDPAFVNPPPSAVPRIQREAKELEGIWQSMTPKLWEGAFVAPVPQPANSAFGTRTILNGEPKSPHSGADFGSPIGTAIKAPNAGRVVLADSLYYTGNTIVLDHGLGLYSLFAHLSEVGVHAGDIVKTGDVVGAVGATGRVTGPHLHWSVRVNGARVDPVSLLQVLGPGRN
jgi:murein DD-endopeptidase MepM/ murein hydrolase activator NlpD